MKRAHLSWFVCFLVAGAILVGCRAAPSPAEPAMPATYSDAFAYCAAVGTVDDLGAGYVGPRVPESVARGLQQALSAPETPIDVLQNGTVWRCMGGLSLTAALS